MYHEKTINERLMYDGRVIRVFELDVELTDATITRREIARHNGGACMVAIDNEMNIHLVRQFRKPIERMTLEIPAGKLEIGEDPLLCAIRELKEETGLSAKSVEPLGFIYPTPGYCDEKLYIYLATGLTQGQMQLDPEEYLYCEKMHISDCITKIEAGEINDAKTVVGILRTARKLGF